MSAINSIFIHISILKLLGQDGIVDLLIRNNAEIDLIDDKNRSALHWAARLGKLNIYYFNKIKLV